MIESDLELMIESILEMVLENRFETIILVITSLFLGVLVSWLFWGGRIRKRERRINRLDTKLDDKDTNLENMRIRAQELINERVKEVESLNTTLEQKTEDIHNLTLQLSDKDKTINLYKKKVDDLEKINRGSVSRSRNTEIKFENLEKSLRKKEQEIAELKKENQESVNHSESAESKLGELEKLLEENEHESTSLKTRMHFMQDDFTRIIGIGPKVSSVLRSAGVNTFAMLASTSLKKINEILKAENPSLIHLTDPSIWPAQARMASEGDWDALKVLQDSLKGKKRT